MGKYINLFNKTHNEFVRVILFGKTAKVVHFKTGLLIGIRCFDTDEQIKTGQNELLKLLIGLNLPIELVMFHRSMACKLFSTKVSNSKELNSIAIHNLNNSHRNTVFYGKITQSYVNPDVHYSRVHTYGICTCDISDDLTKLLLTNPYDLKIISISVFPLWVTSAFCNQYKCNVKTPVLFVIEYLGYWNIILMNNGYVVYNRSGLLDEEHNDLKEQEVFNTISHIKNVMNIDIKNLIIYEFGDDIIDAISFYSTLQMKVASSEIKTKQCLKKNIAKSACLGFTGIIFSDTLINTYKINETFNQTNEIRNNIKLINDGLVKDINVWDELQSKQILNQPNYKKAIQNYISNKKEKLQNVTMYWDNTCENIICECVRADVNETKNGILH